MYFVRPVVSHQFHYTFPLVLRAARVKNLKYIIVVRYFLCMFFECAAIMHSEKDESYPARVPHVF